LVKGVSMKKLMLAGVMALAMVGVGQAADMMVKAPPPAPVYSWTGWYVGANAGDSWSSSSNTTFSGSGPFAPVLFAANEFPTTLSTSPHGFEGGLQTGYNWQLSSWVIGAETDIQFSRFQGTGIATPTPVGFLPFTTMVTEQSNWFGTLRGRLGFLVTPTVLFYGTGGLAYGQANTNFSTLPTFAACGPLVTCTTGQGSNIKTGFAGGGGVEWMIAPHWTLRGEYLYVDLGSQSVTAAPVSPAVLPFVNGFTASSSYKESIVRAAINFGF
jgi:outer membrane immunogenic protein